MVGKPEIQLDIMHAALQALSEERFCPPESVLEALDEDSRLREHLDNCALCQEKLLLCQEFGFEAQPEVVMAASASVPARADIRALRSECGGWGDRNRFYNSPKTLTLCVSGETARVAQICEMEELESRNDAPLGDGFTGFAEPWNVFEVPVGALGEPLGRVAEDVVRLVEELAGKDDEDRSFPDAGFRRMERDAARFTAQRAEALFGTKEGESEGAGNAPRLELSLLGLAGAKSPKLYYSDDPGEYAYAAAGGALVVRLLHNAQVAAAIDAKARRIVLRHRGLDKDGPVLVALVSKRTRMPIPIGRAGEEKEPGIALLPGTEVTAFFELGLADGEELELVAAYIDEEK